MRAATGRVQETLTAVAFMLVVSGCSSSSATSPATAPSATIPAANLVIENMLGRRSCGPNGPFVFCSNTYDARNLGPGCATNVSATCIENIPGGKSTSKWSLPAGTILAPGQAFSMTCSSMPQMVSVTASLASAAFDFTSVACDASLPAPLSRLDSRSSLN